MHAIYLLIANKFISSTYVEREMKNIVGKNAKSLTLRILCTNEGNINQFTLQLLSEKKLKVEHPKQ